MKLPKLILCTLICGTLLLSTSTYTQSTSYTEEAIEQYGKTHLEKLIQEDQWQLNTHSIQGLNYDETQRISPSSSMYKEYFDSYVPQVVTYKPDAFLVYTASADNRKGKYTKDGYKLTFNSSRTVTGSHSFSGKGSAHLTAPVINQGVQLEHDVELVTANSTAGAVGTVYNVHNLNDRAVYYIDIFFHGIYTSGGAKYRWNDITGNSGTITYPLEGGALYPTKHTTIHASAAYKR